MYCSVDDLSARYGSQKMIELSSDSNIINSNLIIECIQDADAEIDGYVQKVYDTPLDPVPRIIKSLSMKLTIANLYERRNIHDDTVAESKKYAVDLLKSISKKTVSLGLVNDDEESIQSTSISITSKDRIFYR